MLYFFTSGPRWSFFLSLWLALSHYRIFVLGGTRLVYLESSASVSLCLSCATRLPSCGLNSRRYWPDLLIRANFVAKMLPVWEVLFLASNRRRLFCAVYCVCVLGRSAPPSHFWQFLEKHPVRRFSSIVVATQSSRVPAEWSN